MTTRNFANIAVDTTITGAATAGDATIVVAALTGYPAVPWIGRLDAGTGSEEVVLCTNVAGTTLTVTRGYDGTTAKSHLANATFGHVAAAIDYREANTHVNAVSGVHGVTGSVVGTTDTQTVSNKVLSASTLSGVSGLSTASASALKLVKGAAGFTPDLLLCTLEDGSTIVARITAAGDATVHHLTLTGQVQGALTATGVITGTNLVGSGDLAVVNLVGTGTLTLTGKASLNGAADVAGLLKVTQATLDTKATELIYPNAQAAAFWNAHTVAGTISSSMTPTQATFPTLLVPGSGVIDLINAGTSKFKVDSNGNLAGNNSTTRVAYIETNGTNTTSSGTTETFEPLLYQAVTLVSGRRYEAEYYIRVDSSVAATVFSVRIRHSGSASNPTSASTLVAECQEHTDAAAGAGNRTVICKGSFVAASSAVTTFGVSVVRVSGTGDLTMRSPGIPRWLKISDLGVG